MQHALRLALPLLALAAPIACGPRAEDVPYLRQDRCPVGGCVADAGSSTGPIEIPPEPLEAWDTTDAGPLSGIFAVEATIDARVVVPVRLKQLLRLRIVQRGTRIRQKTTLCAFKLPVVENVATLTIPPPLQAVIQQKGAEEEGDFLSSEAVVGAKYTPPPFLVVVGANLTTPATDPLPSMNDLGLAADEDADGAPGVTLLASVLTCPKTERLYVALRTSGVLSGTVASPDVITGRIDVKLAQSMLGFSDPCLSVAGNIVIQIQPGSPLRAVRTTDLDDVDRNGNVSCPEIVARAGAIFGGEWATP
jgi:hypothetical protein